MNIASLANHIKFNDIFEKCKVNGQVSWARVAKCELPQNFINQYFNQLKPFQIERLQKLDETFIDEHSSELNWFSLLRFQSIPESVIVKNIDKISTLQLWRLLLKTQKLSLQFLVDHIDDIKKNKDVNMLALAANASIDDSVKSKVTELVESLASS